MAGPVQAQETGEEIFNRICKACHTIGQGKLVGPDLAGVTKRYDPEWIIPFVQSSQTVIKSGDPVAVGRFEEFNKLIMPDNPISRSEVLSIIAYIETTAGDPLSGDEVRPTPLDTATDDDLALGAALFQGTTRLTGGGPACNTCHHVHQEDVMGGGILAKDLTKVVSRMPAPGVQAILGSPPFPVMQQAYANHDLTEDEIFALTAFLQKLDQENEKEIYSTYGAQIFAMGVVGAMVLMVLYAMIWMNRKKKRVYGAIHDRQLKSI
ncbi:MAG: c-type cytochrome [Candidatus Krumholzibacteriota bacterium]